MVFPILIHEMLMSEARQATSNGFQRFFEKHFLQARGDRPDTPESGNFSL